MPLDWRFGRDILSGLLQANQEGSYGWSFTSHLWREEEVWTLQKHQPPDVVVGSFYNPRKSAFWKTQNIPIVNISGGEALPENIPTITADNEKVGELAARHFIEKGFSSFAYINGQHAPVGQIRGRAFRQHLPPNARFSSFDELLEPAKMKPFFQQLPSSTAIFCATDLIARYVITALGQTGAKVPEDFAVLGVDDDPIHNRLSPVPISSIDIRPEAIGREVGHRIHELLQGTPLARKQLLPPGELIVRQSTDILALNDPEFAAFLSHLRQRACEPVGVREIIETRFGSRRTLENKCRRILGRSVLEEVYRCRLETARQLLLGTSLTLEEISHRCGFCNPPHFSRKFKKAYGQSPGQYRK